MDGCLSLGWSWLRLDSRYEVKFRFHQITPKGLWISPGVFEDDHDAIVAMVMQGHVVGQPRAAVEEDSGRIIFSIDASGDATEGSDGLFVSGMQAA